MMQSFHITSIKDARIVEARELASVAGRARFQKTQLDGEESIQWALEARLPVEHVFYSANLRQRTFLEEVNVTGQMILQAFDHALHNVTELNALQVVLLMMLAVDRQMSRAQGGRDTATFGAELEEFLQPLFDKHYLVPAQLDEQGALHITPEGERAIAQLWSVVEQSENEVLSGFSAQEKEMLLSYLKRIQANCITITQGY